MIAILVLILCLYWYAKRKYDLFVWGLSILLSNLYYFVLPDPMFDYAATALVVIICGMEWLRDCRFFYYKKDKIAKVVLLLVLLFTINCLVTIIFGLETPVSALKVLYNNLFFISYFIFRRIEIKDWEGSLRYILLCSIIGGLFYYLQFIGINVLSGGIQEDAFGNVSHRYMNYPLFTYVFLFYFLFANIKHKYILLVFFIPFIILPMSRGAMLGFILAVFCFLFLKKRLTKSLLKISIPVIIVFFIFQPLIEERFFGKNNKVSFGDEIANIFTWKSYTDFNSMDSDTYSFRIALIWERLDYMFSHPQTVLLGIGSIYENTDVCRSRFNFQIGSWHIDEKEGNYIGQIDSTDVAFMTHFFRYGILYLVLIFQFLFFSYKRFNSINNIWADVALLYLLFSIIRCTASSPFYDFGINRMFPLLLFSGLLYSKTYNRTRLV